MIIHNGKNTFFSHLPSEEVTWNKASDTDISYNRILELANQYYRESFRLDQQNNQNHSNLFNLTDEEKNVTYHSVNDGNKNYYFLKNYRTNGSGKETRDWKEDAFGQSIRKDFPILHKKVNGKALVWLDNGATTQKPNEVIDSVSRYYSQYNSNIHRGAHTLANQATKAYEGAREKVREFIGAAQPEEIIFTRGTTEAINLVAETYGDMEIHEGDEILVSMMEHHSNIVPWQKLQEEKGAVIKVIPINVDGEILLEEYEKLFTPRTKLVAIAHVSNVLGTVNPLKAMIEMAHRNGAHVLVDGAQSVPHMKVDVKDLDTDFYVFSGHKMYGPTGIGILYGKKALLEQMPPWQRGGGMINSVSFDHTTYHNLPYKFEAGTGNIADAIGLGAAIDYLNRIGMQAITEHEKNLTLYAMDRLSEIPGLHLIGTSPDKISVLSFIMEGITPEKVGQYLNKEGIAVRAGHHCAQPVLNQYGLTSSVRASLGIYNMREEIDYLANELLKLAKYYN